MKTHRLISVLLLAMAVGCISCAPGNTKESPEAAAAKERSAMMSMNKMATQKITEMFFSGQLDSLGNYMEENFKENQPNPPGITSTGTQAYKDASSFYRTGFPDMKLNILSLIADEDLVVCHFNVKATNTGPMGTMPPTNKPLDINVVDIYKFANGKVVEHWGYFEEGKFMAQMGMMGEPKSDPKKK
jgi:predicted ester cyclase